MAKSIYLTTRSIGFVLVYDAPSVPRRRHHESFGLPNTVAHSPKLRLVVMMTLALLIELA